MKFHIHYKKQVLLVAALLISLVAVSQRSDMNNDLRNRLMVYYVENPSSDQYTLLN
ncbi:MAG: hypothetical protein HKP53_08620, partial [Eudoraea sp.]|nr:hypothetical protein [Eudoraea sp.]